MRSDIIDLEGYAHHRTPLAMLFSTDGDIESAVWLPFSMIERDNDRGHCTITLPESLAIEKGLV